MLTCLKRKNKNNDNYKEKNKNPFQESHFLFIKKESINEISISQKVVTKREKMKTIEQKIKLNSKMKTSSLFSYKVK